MPEHFRDFRDPEIDTYATALLEHRGPDSRALVKLGEAAFNVLGGKRLPNSDDGQRWGFPDGTGNQAVLEILDPDFIPGLLLDRDVALFYGYTESQWRPDAGSTHVPEDVDTGNPEADSLVMVGAALHRASRLPRGIGRTAARAVGPLRDWRARREWAESTDRTKEEIWAHYDLSQDVYTGPHGFLDPEFVQYSSGLLLPGQEFESLGQLQEQKVDSIVSKLELETADTLLEVGSGWGGLAVAIAKRAPNLHITSLTVSDEQLKRAHQRAEDAGVADRVTFIGEDYRNFEVKEPFDRVVSVEMIEAVDWRDHNTYFNSLVRFANPDTGVVVIQSINIKPGQFASQRHNKSFANTAIFPGGVLTPKNVITDMMYRRGWRTHNEHEATDLSSSYALTLREWTRNLFDNRPALTEKWLAEGTSEAEIERFYKGFSLYLQLSQSGFRPETGNITGSQLTFQPS